MKDQKPKLKKAKLEEKAFRKNFYKTAKEITNGTFGMDTVTPTFNLDKASSPSSETFSSMSLASSDTFSNMSSPSSETFSSMLLTSGETYLKHSQNNLGITLKYPQNKLKTILEHTWKILGTP